MERLSLVFLASILAVCHASHEGILHPIHLLRPKSGCGHHIGSDISCISWRLAVETNNVRNWRTVPLECVGYVGHYMLGELYRKDSELVADAAVHYAQSLNLTGDDKDIWIFDIDETALSNIPYYADNGFGAEVYNDTSFNEWVNLGKAPALPNTLKLYKKLLSLGIKVVFLTGRPEKQRAVTETNLKKFGYHTWLKLILRGSSQVGMKAVEYKSGERKKLEQEGYIIVGNIGDQWSDLLGTYEGKRTFKLPDPMYYIG